MKRINKNGISLIVLIVTIIVIIILAAVVILTLSKNNPIESAKQAAFKEDIRAYQDELNMYITKEYQSLAGQRDSKITATGYEKDSTSEEYNNSVYKYLSSFKKKYENKIAIENDEIVYIGRDKKEREWTNNIVKMNPILTVKYVYENGEEAAPTYEETITDGAYEVDSPIIDGYEPDHYAVSDKINKDTEITVTYYPWSEGLSYEELSDGTYTVAGKGTFTGGILVIPKEYNGKAVTQIKNNSFRNNNSIKKILITNSVKKIQIDAFNNCSNLEYLSLDAEQVIGQYNFSSRKLKEVDIGKNVKSICNNAFSGCSNLTTVRMFSEEAILNAWIFNECTSLKGVQVDSNNKSFCVDEGILYSKDRSILYMYPQAKEDEKFVVPDTVQVIKTQAARSNHFLKQLEILSNVSLIEQGAFESCNNLMYVNLDAKRVIGGNNFISSSLNKVDIGENVYEICNSAFSRCTNLSSLNVFSEKVRLTSFIFEGCTGLKKVNVSKENKALKTIDGVLYSIDEKTLYMYPPGKEDSDFYISSNTEKIVSQMARGNKYIKKVYIPNNIKNLYDAAFEGCTNIEMVNYAGTIEQWKNINKSTWNRGSSITKVICIDGEIQL